MKANIKHTEIRKRLTDEDYLIIWFDSLRGKVVKFCILYQALIDGKIRTIIRVDNSHKSLPHKHVFHKIKKGIRIPIDPNPHIAFNESQKTIIKNFRKIKENYLFAS